MNDIKDMKVIFGLIIGIVLLAVFGIVISTYSNRSVVNFENATTTPGIIFLDNASSTATTTAASILKNGVSGKKVTPEALALVEKIQKIAGVNYPITKQIFTFNYTKQSVKLEGYGFSYISKSVVENETAWKSMLGFLETNMNISILNTGSGDSKMRTYSGNKFVCVLFERPATADARGPIMTSLRCAESANTVK